MTKTVMPPFHLALPVDDLAATRRFYGDLLGCREGRSAPTWVDFDLDGHQLSFHLRPGAAEATRRGFENPVDGVEVPIPHFGLVLDMASWRALGERLRAEGVTFVVEPTVRFEGLPGEQGTLFVRDPSGHVLEFKAMADPQKLFSSA